MFFSLSQNGQLIVVVGNIEIVQVCKEDVSLVLYVCLRCLWNCQLGILGDKCFRFCFLRIRELDQMFSKQMWIEKRIGFIIEIIVFKGRERDVC